MGALRARAGYRQSERRSGETGRARGRPEGVAGGRGDRGGGARAGPASPAAYSARVSIMPYPPKARRAVGVAQFGFSPTGSKIIFSQWFFSLWKYSYSRIYRDELLGGNDREIFSDRNYDDLPRTPVSAAWRD